MQGLERVVLVHLGGGIGNVVLATPLLWALKEMGFTSDVLLAADYAGTADLLRSWSAIRNVFPQPQRPALPRDYHHVIPAIPPFYARRFGGAVTGIGKSLRRPPDELYYSNEQEFYLSFALQLGYPVDRHPLPSLPIDPADGMGVTLATVVLAPGCKTGEMTAKRWPHFPELADAFDDVAIVGTPDDLRRHDGTEIRFPPHVRSLVDKLSLRQTAACMAAAGVVVANDSGLGHVAAAVGVPTIMLFGPTPHQTLGRFPPNVSVLRRGLSCEPCWFKDRFAACFRRISCLNELAAEQVSQEIGHMCLMVSRRRSDSMPLPA